MFAMLCSGMQCLQSYAVVCNVCNVMQCMQCLQCYAVVCNVCNVMQWYAMFIKVRGYKNSTYKDKKKNSKDTFSKLLTCVLIYFGRSSS